MQGYTPSPQKNYRQQSLTGFFGKKVDNNSSRFSNLLNEETAQNNYQQKETFQFNPRNNDSNNNRAFNALKGLSFESNTSSERDQPIMKQQRNMFNYQQNAQSSLDYFTSAGGQNNIPNNRSIIGDLIQQKEKKMNAQNPYYQNIEDDDVEDDCFEVQDAGPFNKRLPNQPNYLNKQISIEDIDDDSIEIIPDNTQRNQYYPQQQSQKGGNSLSQIIDNSSSNLPQQTSKNIFQSSTLNQIFRNKGYSQTDNQSNNSQDAFNFQSNSQQKSSQEILQNLELKKMRDKAALERQQKQKLGLQNYDDIKLNINRFTIDPASLNQKRQLQLDELNQFKFKKDSPNGQPPPNPPSSLSQTQQISNLLNNLNKVNLFLNPTSNPLTEKNKEILEKFNSSKRKSDNSNSGRFSGKSNFEEYDNNMNSENENDDNSSDNSSQDSNSDENGVHKKQKLNDGSRSRYKNHQVTAFYDKIESKIAKQNKLKEKEEQKRQRIKQELIEQAKAEREKKLQEESKMQRSKLAQYKKMQEVKKQKMQQIEDLQKRVSIKEQLRAINFEENFAKTTSLQAKQFLLSSTKEIALGLMGQTVENQPSNNNNNNETTENNQNVTDMAAYDKNFDFLFDETETEEEKKNYFSLIRFIFSQNYNNQDIVRVENKRIPNRAPFNTFIKLTKNKENTHGFFEFQVYKDGNDRHESRNIEIEAGEFNSSDDDYYRLSTLRNHAVLISNQSEPDLSILSSTGFKKKQHFLFFGWVVPPENDKNGVLKIYADIEANSFIRQFQPLDQKIGVKIYNFSKMTTFIREYLSIKNMRYNDLNRFIYNPSHIVEAKTPISNPQTMLPLFEELKTKYNVSQFQSIKEICLTSQGICMLQGPPGTGKTHTLLGLLSGLYYYIKKNPESTKPKIMICAPSNTAVDEIVSRIIEIGLHSPGGQKAHINVLRIGAIDYVPTENVKRACLEYQIERKMKEIGLETNKSQKEEGDTLIDLQIEVAKINQEIDKSKKESYGAELASELDHLFEKKRRIQSKITVLKLEKVARRDQIKNISDQLLGMADVVCCTLASSISEKLERFKNQIEVLIVDEAAQCTEPNNIIPLFYQPNKMVLIGDPKQLPATTFQPDSNVTKYNRSLFERIIDNSIKPYFLDQQYRMDPNIREFPSFQFYDNKLKDGPLVVNRPFPEYLQKLEKNNVQFIDIVFSKEKIINKSYGNEMEGQASISICNAIIEEVERLKKANPEKQENPSIGIITPYKQQTKLISDLVRRQIPKAFHKFIQVNTVDSFQGQEKDIIIFTTVRVNGRDEWRENMIGFLQDERRMNVALTRARYCQIVLGHADTLNSNPIWGAFVDFMAKNNRYCKFRNKEQLNDIGKMVFKGSLLEGSSTTYVKKDWGDDYKAMLLKTNQVNELQLTDFEPIQIEEDQQNESPQQGQDNNENENEEEKNENEIEQDKQIIKPSSSDQVIIISEKLNGEKKISPLLEITEEPDNFDQLKKGRTGVSLKEALEKQEEQKTMNQMRGGLGGLTALIDSNSVKKERSSNHQSDDKKSDLNQLTLVEAPPKEEDAQSLLMKKIFADKKGEVLENKNLMEQNSDIYEIMKQQKRDNLMKQKKEKEQLQKKVEPQTPTIVQAAANAANAMKQKLQQNSNENNQPAPVKQPSYQNPQLALLQSVISAPPANTKSVFGGLTGLIGSSQSSSSQQQQQQQQQPQQLQPFNPFGNMPTVSIYDQIDKQRQLHQDKKKVEVKNHLVQLTKSNSVNAQPNKSINPQTTNTIIKQASYNSSSSNSIKDNNFFNSNNNNINNHNQMPSQNKQHPYGQSHSSQNINTNLKNNLGQQQDNKYSSMNMNGNNRSSSSQNPLSDLLKNKPSSFKQPSNQYSNDNYKGNDDKYRQQSQQQQQQQQQNKNMNNNSNNNLSNIISVKSSAQQLLNNIYMKK